ncbi:MAG: hypothetical protein M3Y72_15050 [Acidobacteriota bacterium]|nr:hypothetical protein [Acidobacteriota bacterium]
MKEHQVATSHTGSETKEQGHEGGGLRGVHLGQRQVRIVLHVQPRGPAFAAAQQQMADGVEPKFRAWSLGKSYRSTIRGTTIGPAFAV